MKQLKNAVTGFLNCRVRSAINLIFNFLGGVANTAQEIRAEQVEEKKEQEFEKIQVNKKG